MYCTDLIRCIQIQHPSLTSMERKQNHEKEQALSEHRNHPERNALCGTLTACGGGADSTVDASAVTNMSYMFQNCSSLQSLDLTGLNTEKVTNMNYMFQNCSMTKRVKKRLCS